MTKRARECNLTAPSEKHLVRARPCKARPYWGFVAYDGYWPIIHQCIASSDAIVAQSCAQYYMLSLLPCIRAAIVCSTPASITGCSGLSRSLLAPNRHLTSNERRQQRSTGVVNRRRHHSSTQQYHYDGNALNAFSSFRAKSIILYSERTNVDLSGCHRRLTIAT